MAHENLNRLESESYWGNRNRPEQGAFELDFMEIARRTVADALDLSVATVKRDWSVAKTCCLDELRNDGNAPPTIEVRVN